jgi:hypothetical protein
MRNVAAIASRSLAPVDDRRLRWGSWLGIGVAFFLIAGLLNVLAAVIVPLILHLQGAAAVGSSLVWSSDGDAALLGRSLKDVAAADPKLSTYLVSFMDTMCAMMMGWGLVSLAVTWFALRRARIWSYWTLVIANLGTLVYYVLIIPVTYAGAGAPVASGYVVLLFYIPFAFGTIAAGIGLLRQSTT